MATTSLRRKTVATAISGAAALAAAAATAYYFAFDDKAKQHRQKAKHWAYKAKQEVVRDLKKVKALSRPAYNTVIAEVMKRYTGYKQAAPKEINQLRKELKGYWGKISKEIQSKSTKKAKTAGGKARKKKR